MVGHCAIAVLRKGVVPVPVLLYPWDTSWYPERLPRPHRVEPCPGAPSPGDRPLLGAASQPPSVEVMWREEIKAWPIWRGELGVAWPGW